MELVDEHLAELDPETGADLVGITVMTAFAPALTGWRITSVPRGSRWFWGMHVSALPEEAQAHADAVVVGEAEKVWPQVVADAERGN